MTTKTKSNKIINHTKNFEIIFIVIFTCWSANVVLSLFGYGAVENFAKDVASYVPSAVYMIAASQFPRITTIMTGLMWLQVIPLGVLAIKFYRIPDIGMEKIKKEKIKSLFVFLIGMPAICLGFFYISPEYPFTPAGKFMALVSSNFLFLLIWSFTMMISIPLFIAAFVRWLTIFPELYFQNH